MTAAASEGAAPALEGLEAGTLPDGVRLVLVRHGETDWNMVRRIQGQLDEPLNAVGVQQAKAAAARFAPGMVDAIHCSDLLRASQTAAEIGAVTGVPVVPETVWRERHFGRFQGWVYADIQREDPETYRRIEARDPDLDLQGGESLMQVRARIEAALADLVQRYRGQRVVVVFPSRVIFPSTTPASASCAGMPGAGKSCNGRTLRIWWPVGTRSTRGSGRRRCWAGSAEVFLNARGLSRASLAWADGFG